MFFPMNEAAMTEEKLLIILDELGVQFKTHQDPARGWCWRVVGIYDWSDPHATKDHVIAAALRHVVRQARLLKVVDDIALESGTGAYDMWTRLIRRAEEDQ